MAACGSDAEIAAAPVGLRPEAVADLVEQDAGEDGAESRGLVGSLLPRPPHRSRPNNNRRESDSKQQQVWRLVDGEPFAVPVATGSTNGVMSELLEGEIGEGTSLIVDTLSTPR